MLMLILIKSFRRSSSPDIVGPNVCVIQSDDLNARRTYFEEIQSLALPFLVRSGKKGNYDVWQGGGKAKKINHDHLREELSS